MELHKDWNEFLLLLNSNRVKYLVVGAHALAAHGQPRFTADLDIFVERSSVNAIRIVRVLDKFGFGALRVSSEELTTKDFVIRLGRPPVGIDLLTGISGVLFTTAWKNREKVRIGTTSCFVIAADDFIRNKRAAGRTKDLLDIELLKGR